MNLSSNREGNPDVQTDPASGLVSEIVLVTGQLIALMEQEVSHLREGDRAVPGKDAT